MNYLSYEWRLFLLTPPPLLTTHPYLRQPPVCSLLSDLNFEQLAEPVGVGREDTGRGPVGTHGNIPDGTCCGLVWGDGDGLERGARVGGLFQGLACGAESGRTGPQHLTLVPRRPQTVLSLLPTPACLAAGRSTGAQRIRFTHSTKMVAEAP